MSSNIPNTKIISEQPEIDFYDINDDQLLLVDMGDEYRSMTLRELKRAIGFFDFYNKTPGDSLYDVIPARPVIQHGVIDCPLHQPDGYDYLVPGFLQLGILPTSTVHFKSPAKLVFSSGIVVGGNYHGAPNSIVKDITQDESFSVYSSSYIYAELTEDGNIEYDIFPLENKFYYQEEEPENPEDNTHWFDVKNNLMRVYDENKQEWINKLRIILAFLGTTPDGYLGCILSYVPNASSGQYSHFDVINENVFDNETAMQAIANSETAMQAIANSETAMQAIADSEIAMQAIKNNMVSTGNISYNTKRYNTVSELSDGNFYFLVEGWWSSYISSRYPGSIRVDSGTYERTGFGSNFQEFLWPVYNKVEVNPRGGPTGLSSEQVELWYLKF